jgi:hypothetical protein
MEIWNTGILVYIAGHYSITALFQSTLRSRGYFGGVGHSNIPPKQGKTAVVKSYILSIYHINSEPLNQSPTPPEIPFR